MSHLYFLVAQVMIVITGAHKAFALYKAIEDGVNHMWTVSAFQQHPRTIFVCDEDATLELRVKTVKYFKGETETLCLVFTVWFGAAWSSSEGAVWRSSVTARFSSRFPTLMVGKCLLLSPREKKNATQ